MDCKTKWHLLGLHLYNERLHIHSKLIGVLFVVNLKKSTGNSNEFTWSQTFGSRYMNEFTLETFPEHFKNNSNSFRTC